MLSERDNPSYSTLQNIMRLQRYHEKAGRERGKDPLSFDKRIVEGMKKQSKGADNE